MPNAYHPAGINITFVGGSVRFVSDQIDPTIYAQLMTSNRNRSNLVSWSEYRCTHRKRNYRR